MALIRTITSKQLDAFNLAHRELNGISGAQEGEPVWPVRKGAIDTDAELPFQTAWDLAQLFPRAQVPNDWVEPLVALVPNKPTGKVEAVQAWIRELGKCRDGFLELYRDAVDDEVRLRRGETADSLNGGAAGQTASALRGALAVWANQRVRDAADCISAAHQSGAISDGEGRALWQELQALFAEEKRNLAEAQRRVPMGGRAEEWVVGSVPYKMREDLREPWLDRTWKAPLVSFESMLRIVAEAGAATRLQANREQAAFAATAGVSRDPYAA